MHQHPPVNLFGTMNTFIRKRQNHGTFTQYFVASASDVGFQLRSGHNQGSFVFFAGHLNYCTRFALRFWF